jgi:alkylation response protein AidB-like acyl-CoA dehydrogenase
VSFDSVAESMASDPDLDDDDVMLRRAIRERCPEFADDYWTAGEQKSRFPDECLSAMPAAGWLGLAILDEFGAGGLAISLLRSSYKSSRVGRLVR